jgi:hypothetical protein
MSFVLNEFTIIMFLVFFLTLILSGLISVRIYKHLLLNSNNYYQKIAKETTNIDYIGSFNVKDYSSKILKQKINYFDVNEL